MSPSKTILSGSSVDLEDIVDASAPLLVETAVVVMKESQNENDIDMDQEQLIITLRRYISIVGAVVGVLSVLSDLGAHALFLLPGTHFQLILHTYTESVLFATVWTIVFTSVVLYMLHSVMTIVTVSYRIGSSNVKALLSAEDLFQLEGKFLCGTMVGTCTMWGFIDAATGMTHGVWCSIGALVVALLIAKVFIQYCRPAASKTSTCENKDAEILIV